VARARQIIEEESGKHFDPAVVEAFRTCFNRFVQVGESLRDQVPLAHGAMAFKEHDQAATAACGATSC
jgi:HD-GYP domain-containing protein (c-di-GMP phosphodiesterase class II)